MPIGMRRCGAGCGWIPFSTPEERFAFHMEHAHDADKSLRKDRRKRKRKAKGQGQTVSLKAEKLIEQAERRIRYAARDQREIVLKRDGFKCRYCGHPVTMQTANVDHVKPWKHGGKTTIDNLVTCCRMCNASKGNKARVKPPAIGKPTDPFGVNMVRESSTRLAERARSDYR